MNIIEKLTSELNLKLWQTEAAVKLLDEGNTVPFIARYRKEMTGSCDDQVLRELFDRLTYLRNLEKRKAEVLSSIEEQGKLTEEITRAVENAVTLVEVEDIYRPYKQKRRTRASVAKEKGLEPLALLILEQSEETDPVSAAAEYIDEDGSLKTITVNDMELSYRHSMFSGTKRIITSVTMQLREGSYGEIKAEMEGYLNQRRAKQPLELPSAGSTFKRPVGSYASMLIDQCGLKGASVGDAQVSTKHAGFVVNTGKATCKDVLELCDYVIETVREKTGYELELEPVVLR